MGKKSRKTKSLGEVNAVRRQVFERDGWKCYLCGRTVGTGGKRKRKGLPLATIDHFVPKSKGGTNELDNLKTACHSCNTGKGSVTFVLGPRGSILRGDRSYTVTETGAVLRDDRDYGVTAAGAVFRLRHIPDGDKPHWLRVCRVLGLKMAPG